MQIGTNSAKSIAIQCELIFTKIRGKSQKKAFHFDHIGLISKLYNGLHNQEQLTDFINLAQGLLDGKIKLHNMAWTVALHMGRFSACTTTCNMKYDKHYVDIFSVLYLLFGASCLNVLRGPLHFRQVVSGDCKKGLYLPSEAKCNFAVPHLNVLKKIDTGYPRIVPPGIVKYTLDKLEK